MHRVLSEGFSIVQMHKRNRTALSYEQLSHKIVKKKKKKSNKSAYYYVENFEIRILQKRPNRISNIAIYRWTKKKKTTDSFEYHIVPENPVTIIPETQRSRSM